MKKNHTTVSEVERHENDSTQSNNTIEKTLNIEVGKNKGKKRKEKKRKEKKKGKKTDRTKEEKKNNLSSYLFAGTL